MKRSHYLSCILTGAAVFVSVLAGAAARPAANAAPAASPATEYYPLSVGNKWSFGLKRITRFSLTPASGPARDLNTTTDGTQNVEITRQDDERSGEHGKVWVQRTSETAISTVGAGDQNSPPSAPETRLIGESYFRVNDRGVWLISDGEPDAKGESVEKITDRRLPLLWVPAGMKPDTGWTITCQIDSSITARITSHVGKAQSLKIGGATYEGCLPVVSLADHLSGRLDLGIGKAPIIDGRLVDVTWYAPKIGVVKTHQLANFQLEPPSAGFTAASAHFEESEDLQPGYKVQE